MFDIILIIIMISAGMFSLSNRIDIEIELRNKILKDVYLDKNYKKILFFKQKNQVLNIALYERILGFIFVIISIITIILFYFFNIDENYYYIGRLFWILICIAMINIFCISAFFIYGKLQQKYSFWDLKNDKKNIDIKEYRWNKYIPFAGDVCMFKEQGFKYLRAEEWYKDGEFCFGKTEMYFNTNPPNELKRYLQNLDIICK